MAALKPIDLDRGVSMRMNHGLGMMVVMYKDDPGIYLAPNGIVVDPDVARAAGFDVDSDLRERERRHRRAEALAKIDKEYEIVPEGEIVQDTGDFRVVHAGGGWFDVEDIEGVTMNPQRMRREAAVEFLDVLRKGKDHVNGTSA